MSDPKYQHIVRGAAMVLPDGTHVDLILTVRVPTDADPSIIEPLNIASDCTISDIVRPFAVAHSAAVQAIELQSKKSQIITLFPGGRG
jgi:hypothetical protein